MYPNDEEKLKHARNVLQKKARDNARTPVQWTADANAGFTDPASTSWMRVNDDYKTVNVDTQLGNPSSVRTFWKRSLEGRKIHKDVFVYGDFKILDEGHEKVVSYLRWSADEMFVTVLNFSGEEVVWDGLGNVGLQKWVAGTYEGVFPDVDGGKVKLRPWEGLLGSCKGGLD